MQNGKITRLPTPTNAQDIATKEYVDNATRTRYAGTTPAVSTGNLGGMTGANSKCDGNYSGSHMCTVEEIVRSGETSLSSGWVLADGARDDAYFTTSIVELSQSGTAAPACNGYTSSSSSYYGLVIYSGEKVAQVACNDYHYGISCCY